MRILDALVRPPVEARLSLNQLGQLGNGTLAWSWGGQSLPEQTDGTWESLIDVVHRRSSVVSSAVTARQLLLSQVRFRWRRDYSQNKPGELWGDRSLRILERPGSCTRSELLMRLEQDVSYAGNAYILRTGDRLVRLDPSRVSFVLGSTSDPSWDASGQVLRVPYDAEVLGYLYHPDRHNQTGGQAFDVGEVAHWAPDPDPEHFWRGASWVSAVLQEVLTDRQAVDHTAKFFENGTSPSGLAVFPAERAPEEVEAFAAKFRQAHAGVSNAHKWIFMGGGADIHQMGSKLNELDMKDLTGGFETRIAERARIPGVILGIREGYAGSSLNAGNYNSARRMWADGWFSPTVESLCEALSRVVDVPDGSDLFHDAARVLFLQEDQKDRADIQQTQAVTMRQLVEAGYDPASVTAAVTTDDMTKLVHTGNVSVQLQPPGSGGTNNGE